MRLLLLLLLTIESSVLFAQSFQKQDLITFDSRVNKPITTEVIRTRETLSFYADNKSYYPYRLEFVFTSFRNLSPTMSSEEFILHPGRNLLFKLTVPDPSQSPVYSYSIRYRMGDPNEKADENFIYLFPGKKGKTLEKDISTQSGTRIIYRGTFKEQKGDTVFAVRKGIVTALPDMKQVTDRILKTTLEARHADGTIAVYSNVDPNLLFVQYGDKIFPGQPIGIVGELNFLRVNVYRFIDEGKLAGIDIKYAVDGTSSLTFNEVSKILVEHPETIIEKELTDREIKKLRKGNLYSITKED